MDQENNQEKIREAQKHLTALLYDDYTNRLFNVTACISNNRTKYLDDTDLGYILDGLKYEGKFRKPWEARAEFMWRFLDTLIARGEAGLLLSAAVESSKRGVDWHSTLETKANISLNEWIDKQNERFNYEM